MKPQINDLKTWHQADCLMQPAFIRLIDNLRQAIEPTSWESHYEDLQDWPEATTKAQKQRWEVLTAQLETTEPVDVAAIEAELAQLPTPELSYRLNVQQGDHCLQFDLWQLCYQVCFCNYIPGLVDEPQQVMIDETLLEPGGEVDWIQLDAKVKAIVAQLLASLPTGA